jgi:molybdopterin synthase catalytic subunit
VVTQTNVLRTAKEAERTADRSPTAEETAGGPPRPTRLPRVSDVIRLLDIREKPLSVDEVYATVLDERAGAVDVFIGTVRGEDRARAVAGLGYTAHPSAIERLREVAEAVAETHPILALSALHRVGDLEIGDIAVIVAVSSGHRGDAFAACQQLIDTLKATLPIWKHQVFRDGSDEWVGTP